MPEADLLEAGRRLGRQALITLVAATLIDRLRAYCDGGLPSIRRPRHYDVVTALPRHPNGKLRKVDLREEYRRRAAS